MAKADILKLLEDEQARAERKHHAVRLAAALMTQLGIYPEGKEWVCCLADLRCSDNRASLIEWISRRLPDDDCNATQLPELRQKLLVQFESFMEASA